MTKKRYYKKSRAQAAVEYAMLVACIVAALISMRIYIKRSIQGRIKDAADQIGEQYSARHSTSTLTQTITNPDAEPVTITGKPVFIDIINPDTGNPEKLEVMEVTRHENTTVTIGGGSNEETGNLSDEELFD